MIGIYAVKPRFQLLLSGVSAGLVARRVHPDLISYAALAVAMVLGAALYISANMPAVLLAVPVLALLRTILNALDGMVARAGETARPWGEVVNEFTDRLADVAVFGGLALAATTDLLLGAAVVIAILLSSYVGLLSKAAGAERQYGGPLGKADRMIVLSVISVAVFFSGPWLWNATLVAVLVGLVATVVLRGRAARRQLKSLEQAG